MINTWTHRHRKHLDQVPWALYGKAAACALYMIEQLLHTAEQGDGGSYILINKETRLSINCTRRQASLIWVETVLEEQLSGHKHLRGNSHSRKFLYTLSTCAQRKETEKGFAVLLNLTLGRSLCHSHGSEAFIVSLTGLCPGQQ